MLLHHNDKTNQEQIAVFGGGDNLGEFFNEFTSFQIETC